MGFFDFLRGPNINDGVNQYKDTPGAVLIDVREQDEYKQGHIPGSKNVPLSQFERIKSVVRDRNTPVFVYCLSGGRSSQATAAMSQMGYNVVTNIGGISGYSGELAR